MPLRDHVCEHTESEPSIKVQTVPTKKAAECERRGCLTESCSTLCPGDATYLTRDKSVRRVETLRNFRTSPESSTTSTGMQLDFHL